MAENTGPSFIDALKNLGEEYERDLRGNMSPFRREISRLNGTKFGNTRPNSLSHRNNMYLLESYQWYTSDIARMYKDDYYNNILMEFAQNNEVKPKGFVDSVVTGAKEKINDAKNTLIDSANQIKKSVNNLLDKKDDSAKKSDKVLSEDDTIRSNFNDYLHTFPYAKVYEFKVQDTLGTTISILATGMKMIDSMIDSKSSGLKDIINDILQGVNDFFKTEFKVDFNNLSSSLRDPNTRIIGIPDKMYKQLITGFYTAYYEIPIFGYDEYLYSNGSEGWSDQSFMQRFFGSTANDTVKEMATSHIGSSIDIASRPKWSIEGGGGTKQDITFNVILYNDNLNAVFNNLSFIHSFVGGNFWYQDTFIQKCPSLYQLEVPGRFKYYFCTCTVKVKYIGKIRKILNKDDSSLKQVANASKILNKNINISIFENIPDAYSVDFTFNSLIPNNYNTYISYILNASDSQIAVGQTVDSLWEKLSNSINAAVTDGDKAREQSYAGEGPPPTS